MSALISVRRLEFVRPRWDYLVTGAVTLDVNGPKYRLRMWWRPLAEHWRLDVHLSSGTPIVTGAIVRDRTDAILGVSTAGRPAGAIMSYDPKGRGDPTLDSYSVDGVGLYYVPAGLNPADFDAYATAVA